MKFDNMSAKTTRGITEGEMWTLWIVQGFQMVLDSRTEELLSYFGVEKWTFFL